MPGSLTNEAKTTTMVSRSDYSLGIMYRREHAPEKLPDFARKTEEAGFDELWVVEDCFYGSGIAAAAAASGLYGHPDGWVGHHAGGGTEPGFCRDGNCHPGSALSGPVSAGVWPRRDRVDAPDWCVSEITAEGPGRSDPHNPGAAGRESNNP